MADRVITTDQRPRETYIVEEDHHEHTHNSTGVIVALVIVLVLLFLFVMGNPFGRTAGHSGGTNVNVTPPTTTTK